MYFIISTFNVFCCLFSVFTVHGLQQQRQTNNASRIARGRLAEALAVKATFILTKSSFIDCQAEILAVWSDAECKYCSSQYLIGL